MSSVLNATSSDASSALLNATNSSKKASDASATENRFLSLLVAQMKNQDPLNPLDNAQVTSQMAQLSTVQGIEKMNSSLSVLSQNLGSNQVAQAAGLIGHGVLVPGNKLSPDSGDNAFGFELQSPVDDVKVSIVDASGKSVRGYDLGSQQVGVSVLAWDGLTDNGTPAAAGQYSFKIDAVQAGKPVEANALHLGMVDSVSQNAQGVQLNLASGSSAGYADVKQIF